jgi:YidC/Oxa1 family membrane protein insertase
MSLIENIHLGAGIPYWGAIVATTVGLRLMLIYPAIKGVQNAARMGALRPIMHKMTEAMAANPNQDDSRVKTKHQADLKQLFVTHKVDPLSSLMLPIIQLPIFITLFMGLREIPNFLPGVTTGGAFWFTDLSAADPYYIFPVLNAVSFLAMIELGADGFQTQQQTTFKWVRAWL